MKQLLTCLVYKDEGLSPVMSENNMCCFVFSMQYPFSGCGLLSKKQYAASAAIILTN